MQSGNKYIIHYFFKELVNFAGCFFLGMLIVGIVTNPVSTPDAGGEYMLPTLLKMLMLIVTFASITTLLEILHLHFKNKYE